MSRFLHRPFITSLLSFLMIALPSVVHAAPQLPESDLTWHNISFGSRKLAVYSLLSDSRGLVWLGTNSGLYFFDGVSTHSVGDSEMYGLQIYAILEREGQLLLGSNNGLVAFNLAKGEMEDLGISTPKEIRTLLLVEGELWLGSLEGLYKVNLSSKEITSLSKGLPHKSIYSLIRDSRGVVYAGTYNGLSRWDVALKQFVPVKSPIETESGNTFVNCLMESGDANSIYVGTEGQLYRYIPHSDTWMTVSPMNGNNIKSLAKTVDNHLLVGTDDGLYEVFNDTVKHYRHDSRVGETISNNEVWCILPDSNSNIFAGHENGFSIAAYPTLIKTIKLGTLTSSGEGNEIHSILRDHSGNIWVTGLNGAILLSDNHNPQWFRPTAGEKSISHNHIRSLIEDFDNNVWLCTDAGINRYNPLTNQFDKYQIVDKDRKFNSNWVYDMADDGSNYWIGSYLGGLHLVNKNKFTNEGGIVEADMSINSDSKIGNSDDAHLNDLVSRIEIDRNGNLWVLFFRDNSLMMINPGAKSFEKVDIYALTEGYPVDMTMDSGGRIWCAFKGGCIVFNSPDSYSIVKFPPTDGDEAVLAMGKVGNDVWVSTSNNVWSIDGKDLTPSLLPIPQKSYTAIYDDVATGNVILGGTDEIVVVNPVNLRDSGEFKKIKMLVKSDASGHFSLDNLRHDTQPIDIPYGGKLTLIMSTLDYSPDIVHRYAYKLCKEPSDTASEWTVLPEGANTLTLSDLSSGDYNVLIKMVGAPTEPISVPLRIGLPWFLSWWALLLYVLLILAVIAWIVWYTRKRNLRRFEEKERAKELDIVEKKLSFLTGISHDLKTPLSMIMGPVSLMKEKTKNPSDRKNLELVYDNAVQLNTMIHRALELQHVEAGAESMLIVSLFDAVDFCRSVFESFRDNNQQKKFIFHTSCNELIIEADAVKFESVLVNLLSNAVKYSEEGATISLGISAEEGSVQIVVSDDGVGIPEQDQSLVFQRMFRSPSTAEMREGTGLGLYLIKRYLELMNGNIELYSKEGEGTSFIVTLPLSEKSLANLNLQGSESDLTKPKILVVEDNIQISSFLSELLKDDYTCLFAENGRSGLSLALTFMPDLIIADEMMPVMKGLEMVNRLKQNPRLQTIPIIMLTAKSDRNTEYESVKSGVDVFMPKPFEPSVLLERIKQLLGMRKDLQEKMRIKSLSETKPIEAESVSEKQIATIAETIEKYISDPELNVNTLSEKTGINSKQLYRVIKKYIGTSPLEYIRRVRLQKAAMLLGQHRFTVSEVSYMVGFKTPSYFAKCFQGQYGVKPSEYKSDDDCPPSKTDK